MMSKTRLILWFYFICSLTLGSVSSAADSERILAPASATSTVLSRSNSRLMALSAQDIFQRTEAVLNYYGVPAESDSMPYLSDLQGAQSQQGIQKVLRWMDPSKVFARFGQVTFGELVSFLDFDSKQIVDAKVSLKAPLVPLTSLAPVAQAQDSVGAVNAVGSVQDSVSAQAVDPQLPLKGLRIALDPGHMGGKFWDELTGKFVKDRSGRVVSEGVIALQTCLILKEELEKLGAIIMVTHEGFSPVTKIDYSTFDIKPYALNELRESIHMPWFQNLLAAGPPGPDLYKAFDQSPQRRRLFANSSRDEYFIKRADLWARAEMINQFKPDLVLVIHYDTSDPAGDPNGLSTGAPRESKAFVVGGNEPFEFGSRASRKYFLRHLLDANSWQQSMNLSRSIVTQFKTQMGQRLSISADDGSYGIEPGILARNLGIPRRLTAPAISYLECLFYNRPDEFEALLKTNHPMIIDGKNVPYSDRVLQVAHVIRDGVISYAAQK